MNFKSRGRPKTPPPTKAPPMRNVLPIPNPPSRKTKQFCAYCGGRFDTDLDACPNCGAGVGQPKPQRSERPQPCPVSGRGTPMKMGPPPAPHGGSKIRV